MSTPTVGDFIRDDRLGDCEVVRVLPLGTYDIRKMENDKYYRISGLHGATWTAIDRCHPVPGSNFEPTLYKAERS